MIPSINELEELYADTKTCAKLVGLTYVEGETEGIKRLRRGKDFAYKYSNDQVLTDDILKQRIVELVIPPAWQEVWICPDKNGHLLATGIDEKGRKQYIYHPTWRTVRDLIKFYRMIVFGKALPKIREAIDTDLKKRDLNRDKVIGTILWLLDNTYIRIGNDQYYNENESVGLTTMTDENVMVVGPVTTLFFKGKSGKQQHMAFEDKTVSAVLAKLKEKRGARLFRYHDGNHEVTVESDDINEYLQTITGTHVSAKDFRTWGGTLMAFDHLVETAKLPADETPKLEKTLIEAVDAAANVLGNTRTVARSSYVHPDILDAYGTKNFAKYYSTAHAHRKTAGLDRLEADMLYFLEQLFEAEFTLLQSKTAK